MNEKKRFEVTKSKERGGPDSGTEPYDARVYTRSDTLKIVQEAMKSGKLWKMETGELADKDGQ